MPTTMPRSVAFPWPTAVKAPHARLSTPLADRCTPCRSTTRLGRPVEGHFGLLADGTTAVVETAEASGLALLEAKERNLLIASSYGTGELPCRRRPEPSASSSGSAAAPPTTPVPDLQALGVRLLDKNGNDLAHGERLANLTIDISIDGPGSQERRHHRRLAT